MTFYLQSKIGPYPVPDLDVSWRKFRWFWSSTEGGTESAAGSCPASTVPRPWRSAGGSTPRPVWRIEAEINNKNNITKKIIMK